ncbi:hypothetical protein HRbin36_02652 [bacterium HR36]|nr:hypothetical protein HRbin36_02652 [bacterium HR36]
MQHLAAQLDRLHQPFPPERFVEGPIRFPAIKSDANAAAAVIKAAGDEMPALRKDFHLVAICGIPLHLGNGSRIDPRMPREERLRASRPQDDRSRHSFLSAAKALSALDHLWKIVQFPRFRGTWRQNLLAGESVETVFKVGRHQGWSGDAGSPLAA